MTEKVDLEKLAELEAKATPGPWTQDGSFRVWLDRDLRSIVAQSNDCDPSLSGWEDFDLCLAARNALPALIAEIREARKRIELLEAQAQWRSEIRREMKTDLLGNNVHVTTFPERPYPKEDV